MTDEDLLNSCRLFWRFPDSATWHGIEYAVVAYGGRTRAAAQISGFIGPFWGRHGFRGHALGAAWKTQRVVRATLDSVYTPTPGGIPGNDDLGTMSS
jgi:hypothetical protein